MANLNKVLLIGRLTRDPEVRTFANGGKVAKFGFAVNNRRKNVSTGQWEDEPVFIDVDVFNRGEQGRQADLVEQSLRKGHQVFIEGHLRFEQWTSQEEAHRRGHVGQVPHFNSVSRLMSSPEVTPVLKELVSLSSLPLSQSRTLLWTLAGKMQSRFKDVSLSSSR